MSEQETPEPEVPEDTSDPNEPPAKPGFAASPEELTREQFGDSEPDDAVDADDEDKEEE